MKRDEWADVYSEHFDARRALLSKTPIVLPHPNIAPFDFFERCRHLLAPSDPDFLAPPQRRNKNTTTASTTTASTASTSSTTTSTSTSTSMKRARSDNDNDGERTDDNENTSSSFLDNMMASIANFVSRDLIDARADKRRVSLCLPLCFRFVADRLACSKMEFVLFHFSQVTVSMRICRANPLHVQYEGVLFAYDRHRNLVSLRNALCRATQFWRDRADSARRHRAAATRARRELAHSAHVCAAVARRQHRRAH